MNARHKDDRAHGTNEVTRSNSTIGRDDVAASKTHRRTAGRGVGRRKMGCGAVASMNMDGRAVALGYGWGVPAGGDIDSGWPAAGRQMRHGDDHPPHTSTKESVGQGAALPSHVQKWTGFSP